MADSICVHPFMHNISLDGEVAAVTIHNCYLISAHCTYDVTTEAAGYCLWADGEEHSLICV